MAKWIIFEGTYNEIIYDDEEGTSTYPKTGQVVMRIKFPVGEEYEVTWYAFLNDKMVGTFDSERKALEQYPNAKVVDNVWRKLEE